MKRKGLDKAFMVLAVIAVILIAAPYALAAPPCNGTEITVIIQNNLGETIKKVPSGPAHYTTSRKQVGHCGALVDETSFTKSSMNISGTTGPGYLSNGNSATGKVCIDDTQSNIDTIHSQWEREDGTRLYCEKKQANVCANGPKTFKCIVNPSNIGPGNQVPIQQQ